MALDRAAANSNGISVNFEQTGNFPPRSKIGGFWQFRIVPSTRHLRVGELPLTPWEGAPLRPSRFSIEANPQGHWADKQRASQLAVRWSVSVQAELCQRALGRPTSRAASRDGTTFSALAAASTLLAEGNGVFDWVMKASSVIAQHACCIARQLGAPTAEYQSRNSEIWNFNATFPKLENRFDFPGARFAVVQPVDA